MSSRETLRRKICWLLLGYVVNVLAFALIYWVIWMGYPDYFIVHRGFNALPIQQLRRLATLEMEPDLQEYPIVELGTLYGVSAEKTGRYLTLSDRIEQLRDQKEKAEQREDAAYKVMNEAAEENFQRHFDREMESITARELAIREEITRTQRLADQTDNALAEYELRTRAAELRVDLAEVQYEKAQREYELHSEYLDNRMHFIEPQHLTDLERASADYDRIEEELLETQEDLAGLRADIWTTWGDMYASRVSHLGFLDFTYFSLTVSTANTFGDILPNHSMTRIMVVAQLVVNIVLVGLLVSIFADRILDSADRGEPDRT